METAVVSYLRDYFGDSERTIHRSPLHGAKDEGDIVGLWFRGGRFVLEVKNCRTYQPKEWLRQAERERGNADAGYAATVFHVNGIGLDRTGEQAVLMDLETFCKLVDGAEDEPKTQIERERKLEGFIGNTWGLTEDWFGAASALCGALWGLTDWGNPYTIVKLMKLAINRILNDAIEKKPELGNLLDIAEHTEAGSE